MRSRTLLVLTVAAACALPAAVWAQDDVPQHANGSIGFHNVTAPLGGRWWFGGQKVAIDFGLGFGSDPAPADDEDLTHWAVEVGVPIRLKSWDRIHLLFRPGLLYESEEEQVSGPGDPFATDDETRFGLTAEIEGEVFIVDNFSVSVSQGIGFFNTDPAGGGDDSSSFGTIGNNFTNIGFHIYFFGGGNP